MQFRTLAVLLAASGTALAQSKTSSSAAPTGTAGISPCILTCVSQAAQANGCTSITDLACVCTNTQFKQQATSCLESSCTPAEVQAAQALQSQECAAVTGSSAASGSSTAPSTSATAPASSSSSRSSTSSGASSLSSAASSLSSAASSAASSLSSGASSLTGTSSSSSSGTGAAATTSRSAASALRAQWAVGGGAAGLAVAAVGVVVGAGMVL